MRYFFVLGRNPQLSYAEIYCYFESIGVKYTKVLFEGNFLVIETEQKVELNIQDLGGTIKLGKVLYSGSRKYLDDYIENWFVEKSKFKFCIMGNAEEEVREVLVDKFKREKIRAQMKHSRNKLHLQEGDFIEVGNADMQFFYYELEKEVIFGIVEQDYNYTEVKMRDMLKPVRRESLAISPRLSKLLINLSGAKRAQLLLDPFCGVGGILQEALIKGINCYGVDKDNMAIDSARQNLKWLGEKFQLSARYTLECGDSANLKNISADAVATEPALGEVLRSRLDKRQAREFIERFEDLIIPILRRLKQVKKPMARIAITMPKVKDCSVNIEYVCEQTALRQFNIPDVTFPILESREKQFVGRDIFILV